ncbi:30S ribosomal protein S16, variant [Fonticula alba]|uniref:30S ribosomal protein S16 n=1 Tax=Fonticula alba TaxID=691883 RepID=A0A058ZDP8_FONAL|nr:30S ribosomal protein S16 [Fonticula alba]XP_009492222.1 30S ribosomal protein S16, variant [Fonticula alba]KCV72520.1 30S ribosomal protein S16 [Fonticula alba]KCV72521.1 30S ribosomal protein S16, variant [Fonticula alba]|eukprot:XP_009492221.1 30S ribosomal protein S16 [Fonticula alba]
MGLRIRLIRRGVIHRPTYRIVCANRHSRLSSKYLEVIGHYSPVPNKEGVKRVMLKEERIRYWLAVGAQPSDRAAWLLGKAGILPPWRPRMPAPVKSPLMQGREQAQARQCLATLGMPVTTDSVARFRARPGAAAAMLAAADQRNAGQEVDVNPLAVLLGYQSVQHAHDAYRGNPSFVSLESLLLAKEQLEAAEAAMNADAADDAADIELENDDSALAVEIDGAEEAAFLEEVGVDAETAAKGDDSEDSDASFSDF